MSGRTGYGCLVILMIALGLGIKACGDFLGRDFVAEQKREEADLKALARKKRFAWIKQIRADAQVSIDNTTYNQQRRSITVRFTVTNTGNRTFCKVETGVSTRSYNDKPRGGVLHFHRCLEPGESAKDEWGVWGYTVTSHRVVDVYYKDDCRKQAGWNSLLKDMDCALTHESKYHLFPEN